MFDETDGYYPISDNLTLSTGDWSDAPELSCVKRMWRNLTRCLFDRCVKCSGRFSWGYDPIVDIVNVRSDRRLFHKRCYFADDKDGIKTNEVKNE